MIFLQKDLLWWKKIHWTHFSMTKNWNICPEKEVLGPNSVGLSTHSFFQHSLQVSILEIIGMYIHVKSKMYIKHVNLRRLRLSAEALSGILWNEPMPSMPSLSYPVKRLRQSYILGTITTSLWGSEGLKFPSFRRVGHELFFSAFLIPHGYAQRFRMWRGWESVPLPCVSGPSFPTWRITGGSSWERTQILGKVHESLEYCTFEN